jgi:hypothetical protein
MEFFIRQHSELPILKMEVVNDGRTDSWKTFNKELVNAVIRFSMRDESTGINKIIMNNGFIVEKTNVPLTSPKEYYICYKWSQRDTSKKGRYLGEFTIVTPRGELIAPIRENLFINIV